MSVTKSVVVVRDPVPSEMIAVVDPGIHSSIGEAETGTRVEIERDELFGAAEETGLMLSKLVFMRRGGQKGRQVGWSANLARR